MFYLFIYFFFVLFSLSLSLYLLALFYLFIYLFILLFVFVITLKVHAGLCVISELPPTIPSPSWKHTYGILIPLKPHFYIVKLGFTGVYIIFFISAENIDCGYSLEPPCRGGSNEYPQSMFWAEIWKISEFFIWKFSVFGGEIFYICE